MGTWGVDLYENDDAQDILDAIREGGGIKGMSVIGLQQQLAYAQMPPSERGLFWCILADQMAKAGHTGCGGTEPRHAGARQRHFVSGLGICFEGGQGSPHDCADVPPG